MEQRIWHHYDLKTTLMELDRLSGLQAFNSFLRRKTTDGLGLPSVSSCEPTHRHPVRKPELKRVEWSSSPMRRRVTAAAPLMAGTHGASIYSPPDNLCQARLDFLSIHVTGQPGEISGKDFAGKIGRSFVPHEAGMVFLAVKSRCPRWCEVDKEMIGKPTDFHLRQLVWADAKHHCRSSGSSRNQLGGPARLAQ